MNPAARRLGLCLGLLLALGVAPAGAQAQAVVPDVTVKAAYLYRFLGYVDWPARALAPGATPLVVGVAGADEVLRELRTLVAGRSIDAHPVVVRRLGESDGVEGVHALFVGSAGSLPGWVQKARDQPVLIVTDVPRGVDAGGMLGLVPTGGRIRFEASPAAAERAGLKLSARLLAVAERVVNP
jgi:hypothetical protein